VLAGAVSVQTGAGVANHLFSQIPPASVTTLRLWAGALVLLIIAGRPTARALADVRRRRAWSDALVTAAFGVTLGFMNFAIYQAFARIPLGIAVTIEFLGPLTVTVVGALVGSATARSRALALGCAGLAALGVVMLANGVVGHLNWAGVAWAVGAAFAWACYIIGSKATGQRMPGSSGLVVAMCVAAIAVTIPGVVQGGSRMFRPDLLATGAAIGVLSSVIPYWLEMEALRRISTQLFGVWMSLQPAVAALIGLALLSQRLSPAEWIGIGCVVIASAAASRRPAAPPTPSEALGARAIPPRRSAHPVMARGRDATESALGPEPPEPNASAAGAVNGALRWCACFPV
jgi:inner membrane transporter RhtA